MKNFTIRHFEQHKNQSSVRETFYINRNLNSPAVLRLQFFIDSEWDNYAGTRKISEDTAFIGLILSGRQLRGEEILYPGDAVLERHRGTPLASRSLPGEKLHRLVLIISRTPAFDVLCRTMFSGESMVFRQTQTGPVRQIFAEIEQLAATDGDEQELSGLLFKLLEALHRCQSAFGYPPPLENALQYIRNRGYQPVNRSEIAQASGVSDRQLNHLFRRYLGCSPGQYLISRRMAYARELLAAGRLPVKDIAGLCGYRNGEYFIRDFRNHHGCTPGKYRSKTETGAALI